MTDGGEVDKSRDDETPRGHRCDEKYFVVHRCKVCDEEWDVLKDEDMGAIELKQIEVEPVVELCLNSVVVLTNPGTMKL